MHCNNILVCLFVFLTFACNAGTLIFNDGTVLSNVELISINDGSVVVMKDKTKRSFSLKNIKSYSQLNVGSSSGNAPDDFCDYTVTIIDVKAPKSGEDKEGNKEKFEMTYSISKLPGKGKKIKMPYFYLYILASHENEAEKRKIYRFCYPETAKPKGNNYDIGAVLEKVNGFDRQIWGEDGQEYHRNELGGKKISFELKKIGDKKILAYHLEVWGNNSMIAEKNEIVRQSGLDIVKVADKWWEKY